VELSERRLVVDGETSEKADFRQVWMSRFRNAKMMMGLNFRDLKFSVFTAKYFSRVLKLILQNEHGNLHRPILVSL
jgi:triacylglycerol esterase/lipase EstA (alpha/beta hydrolase family)